MEFFVDVDTAGPGNSLIASIKVENFVDIATFQGSISFDDNILSVDSVTSPHPSISNIIGLPGQGNVPGNAVTFSWVDFGFEYGFLCLTALQ